MAHPAFDLVMFDLDGTLVETAPEIADAVNDTLRRFGLAEVTQAQVDGWIGQGTRELLVQALVGLTGQDAERVRGSALLAQMLPVYDTCYARRCGTRSRLYPGVRKALDALRSQGVRRAVVTNKESRYTRVVLAAHDLQDDFDLVVCGDTLATKKPHPAGVAQCLRTLGVAPGRSVFVGDSSIDAATARAAGVPVWLLPYGYNMGQAVADSRPDRVIDSLEALLTV